MFLGVRQYLSSHITDELEEYSYTNKCLSLRREPRENRVNVDVPLILENSKNWVEVLGGHDDNGCALFILRFVFYSCGPCEGDY